MRRAELDRFDSGRDAGEAGQDDDQHVGIMGMKCLDANQAGLGC